MASMSLHRVVVVMVTAPWTLVVLAASVCSFSGVSARGRAAILGGAPPGKNSALETARRLDHGEHLGGGPRILG
jgi:hypothetical protein